MGILISIVEASAPACGVGCARLRGSLADQARAMPSRAWQAWTARPARELRRRKVSRDWIVRRVRLEEGLRLRELRLQALARAPQAFGSTLAREVAFALEVWHQRAADCAAGR